MRIPFRQGIVTAPAGFLQAAGATVSLVIATPALVNFTIADGTANYLHTERSTIVGAWTGPFTSGTSYWLYVDINQISGARTFGHTLLEPIEAATAPLSPQNDQHWFDTVANKTKVWNATAGRWVPKVRVFAAKYDSGSVFVSMSVNAPVFTGTQVGSLAAQPALAGALVFDINGDPVKRSGGMFFTTEDVVVASVATAAQVKVGAILIEAVATSSIPAYSIVNFAGFHQVELATNVMMDEGAYGMIEVDAVPGDVVNVTLEGVITNPAWDWTAAGVNTPLYVNSSGALTTTPPPQPVVVATVVDVNSILLRPSIQTITYTNGGSVPVATDTVLGISKLSVASATPLSPTVVGDNDPRLSNKVLKAGDTMTGLLVLSGDPAAALGAATKQYVDTRVLKAGDTMTGLLVLSGDPVAALGAATKQYVDNKTPPKHEQLVATAAQTVVTTTVATVAKSGTIAHLMVYVNGILQQEDATKAFTVTGANELTFAAPLNLNDDIAIFAFN